MLKNSVIGAPFNAEAKNCSTVIDQSGSADDELLVDGFPLRSGDWKNDNFQD